MAAVIGIIFTALNLSIVGFQVWLAKRGADDASKQTDRLILNANQIAAAMKSTLDQSRAALDVSTASAQMEQRPWINVVKITAIVPLIAGDKPKVAVAWQNGGKTPAINVTINAGVIVASKVVSIPLWYPDAKADTSIAIVGPSTNRTEGMLFTAADNLTQEDLKSIQDGSKLLHVLRLIMYKDVFQVSHETQFHYSIVPANLTNGLMQADILGNSIK